MSHPRLHQPDNYPAYGADRLDRRRATHRAMHVEGTTWKARRALRKYVREFEEALNRGMWRVHMQRPHVPRERAKLLLLRQQAHDSEVFAALRELLLVARLTRLVDASILEETARAVEAARHYPHLTIDCERQVHALVHAADVAGRTTN